MNPESSHCISSLTNCETNGSAEDEAGGTTTTGGSGGTATGGSGGAAGGSGGSKSCRVGLDVQDVRINGDRINGLFHLLIYLKWGITWGEITH